MRRSTSNVVAAPKAFGTATRKLPPVTAAATSAILKGWTSSAVLAD